MPFSSLNSFIFLLSSWVTLYILQIQLFSTICVFSSCLSVSASVPNLYIQAGTMEASNTFPFSCFFSFLSHIMPSTLLHVAGLACTLLCMYLLLPQSSHTVPPKYAQLFTCLKVFPSTNTCKSTSCSPKNITSVFSRFIRRPCFVKVLLHSCIFTQDECLYTHDSSMCGFISLVIQLINDLCQQQFVVFSRSKQAQGSAVMQQQDITTFKNKSAPLLVEKHSCMA